MQCRERISHENTKLKNIVFFVTLCLKWLKLKGKKQMTIFVTALTIFILAVFVGFEIITKIPPTLHTPLMSGSNAISGITLVGAILSAGSQHTVFTTVLGFIALVLATINVVGGFLVTNRMLAMFKKKK